MKSNCRSKINVEKKIFSLFTRFEKIYGKSTGSSIPQIIVGLLQFVESAHFPLVLTIRLLVTLQLYDLKCVLFILPNDLRKENRWLSLFRKVHFLKFDTGSLGKIWIWQGSCQSKKFGNLWLR